jgi:hypothetical protein
MSDAAKERFDPALVSPLVVYLLSHEAKDVTGRVFTVGGDGVAAIDMSRPVAGLRAAQGQWTAETLAAALPNIIAQLPEPGTSAHAAKFMSSSPVTSETQEAV